MRKILVLSPDAMTRRLLAGMLKSAKCQPVEADSQQAAVGLLIQNPDLIIFDAEAADDRGAGIYAKMPLIIIANEEGEDDHDLKKRLRAPRAEILQKPVTPEHLAAAIESILGPAPRAGAKAAGAGGEAFMRRAIDLSQKKMDENRGGPFGAVVVKHGKIVGEGWNAVTSTHDPTAHAEVMAIRNAARALESHNLEGCEIYTSCEPCPMCLSAIYWARIERVYYANTREDAEAIGFDDDFIYREIPLPEDERSLPMKMMMRAEARTVFDNWLKKPDKTPY